MGGEAADQVAELQQPLRRAPGQGAHRFGVVHHLPERHPQLIGGVTEPLHGGLADAAPRHIQYPQQADAVGRVDQQPQVGQHVLDLTAVVEAQPAHHDVRDPPAHQGFLHCPALGIGAI